MKTNIFHKSLICTAFLVMAQAVLTPAVIAAPVKDGTYTPRPEGKEHQAVLRALRKPVTKFNKNKPVIFAQVHAKVGRAGWAYVNAVSVDSAGKAVGPDFTNELAALLRRRSGRWNVVKWAYATDVISMEWEKLFPKVPAGLWPHRRGETTIASGAALSKPKTGIRSVDFKNFDYGAFCPGSHKFLPTDPKDKMILRAGRVQFSEMNYANLGSVQYIDFNADGKEEAFVVINGQTSGSSNSFVTAYVFTSQRGKAQQIWNRCEENSEAKTKGRSILFTYPDWLANDAHCCPTYAATDTYRWKGAKIVRISKKRKKIV